MHLEVAMTYSAYREIEMVPRDKAQHVSQAILDLADNPCPEGAVNLSDCENCYYYAIDGWYILYHISSRGKSKLLTVFGVLDGPTHTLH